MNEEPPPQPTPTQDTSPHRRRRSHQSSKGKRRRHRDLTPEEDNRRHQRRALLYAIPFVLIPIGLGAWVYGARSMYEELHEKDLILTGKIMLGIGVAWLLILFARGWFASLKKVIWEWRNPPQNTGVHWTKQRTQRRRRHRHSADGSASAETTKNQE